MFTVPIYEGVTHMCLFLDVFFSLNELCVLFVSSDFKVSYDGSQI